jgi:2-(3-amino-3-carboxypropyl)histidine synthase
MKVVYIPTKVKNAGIDKLMSKVDIPGKYAIVTTIQYLDEVNELKKKGYTVLGQILGCNIVTVQKEKEYDSYLYIGTGFFHPLHLAHNIDKPIYVLDPMTHAFSKLPAEIKKKYEDRQRGMLLRYYSAKKVGIIVSIKTGQNQMRRALQFKEKFDEKYNGKKKSYIFLCDTVQSLEDFIDIDCFVNTACIRIFEDDLGKPVVNIRDVEENML